jgi:tetratricopeptide (TPR) repeat protein
MRKKMKQVLKLLKRCLFSSFSRREKRFFLALGIFFFIYLLYAGLFFYRLNDRLAKPLLSQGNHYFNGGSYDLEKAAKWYKIAIFTDHDYAAAHYQLARVYFVQNKLQEAKSEIDQAIKNNPEANRAYYIKGLIDGYSKNYQEAINDFNKFVEKSPGEWAGYNDLAWVYFENKDYGNAKKTLEKGLEVKSDNPWLLNGLGAAYHALGEDEKAKEILDKASQLAGKLTTSEWKIAYPGNDPASADWDMADFKTNIKFNQNLAYNKSSKEAVIVPACHGSCDERCLWQAGPCSLSAICNDPDHYGSDPHGVLPFVNYTWQVIDYNSATCCPPPPPEYCGDGICNNGEDCHCGDCPPCPPPPVAGVCGSANGGVSCDNAGDQGGTLCSVGGIVGGSPTSTNCGWYWTCSGSNGGSDSPRCKSFRSVPLGSCGSMPF